MSNEGLKQEVLDEVADIAEQLYRKIAVLQHESGKQVIGFGFFVFHEDGTVLTDAVGYWDADKVQARMGNFLQQHALRRLSALTAEIFFPGGEQPLNNEQARPALWRGF